MGRVKPEQPRRPKRAAKRAKPAAKRAPAKRRLTKREVFLAVYRKLGNISAAARRARVARSEHYRWLRETPDYGAQFEDAREEAIERLEEEAHRRAYAGVLKPLMYRGRVAKLVREYSDVLLIFLLKAARPEKYRDNYHVEHAGEGGGPVRATIDWARLPVERIEELARLGELLRSEGGDGGAGAG